VAKSPIVTMFYPLLILKVVKTLVILSFY